MKTLHILWILIILVSSGSNSYSQCLAPTTYTSNIYSTQATLNWNPEPSAVQYMLIASLQGIATIDTFYFQAGDSFSVFSNLKKAKTYQWAMKSICDTNGTESPLSQVLTFTTLPAGSCIPPHTRTTADVTNNSAILQWDNVPDVVGYLVKLGGVTSQVNTNTTIWGSLLESTQYVWEIASICGDDTMPSSTWDTSSFASDTFITESCLLTSFLSGYIGEDSIDILWSVAGNTGSYILSGSIVGTATVSDTIYSIGGLSPASEYFFNIQTVCSSGGSDYYSEISDTLTVMTTAGQSSCNIPTPIFTSNVSLESAKINWATEPLALSYTVQGKEVNSSTYVQLSFNGSKNNFVASGLNQGTTYVWKIQANCATDTSVFSSEDTFTTLLCPTPTGLVDTFITANSAWLGWRMVDEAQNYRLYGKESSSPTIVQYVLPADTVIFVNSLMSNSTYFWAVQAICDLSSNNKSFLSKISSFTTTTAPSEKNITSDNFEIFPNPASAYVNINTENEIKIVDVNGRLMYSGQGQRKLNIKEWSAGVYWVEIIVGDGKISISRLIIN